MKKRWILLIVPLLMALMMNAASASELLGNVLSLVLNSPDDAVLADDCRADAEDARIIIASGAHYQLIAAAKQENGWESAVVSTVFPLSHKSSVTSPPSLNTGKFRPIRFSGYSDSSFL